MAKRGEAKQRQVLLSFFLSFFLTFLALGKRGEKRRSYFTAKGEKIPPSLSLPLFV